MFITFASMYTHLFFDLDHTLWDFDTNAHEALHDLHNELQLAQYGITDIDNFITIYLAHNYRMWQQYNNNLLSADVLKWKRMYVTLQDFGIESKPLAVKMSELFLHILPNKKAVFAHTHQTLDYLLNKGYTLHLITNGFAATQARKLQSSNLSHYFTHIITSETVGHVKPQKEIYDAALHLAQASITQSIMIGDNADADIGGAHKAGWHTVFVNHINATVPAVATYNVNSLLQLQALF